MTETAPPRLAMEGIWKSFGGVAVLRDVEIYLRGGETLALLGQNGAGKSTLIKILCGEYSREQGTIRVDGEEAHVATPRDAILSGIRMLPQEISSFPDLPVEDNIFIGNVPQMRPLGLPWVDRDRMRNAARAALADIGLDIDPRTPLKELSSPEKRIVEIARAVASRARILVMDEPTAALTAQEADRLFQIIERLKARGVSIIYISHRLDEVFRISDRITVLRDGGNSGDFVTGEVRRDDVLRAMVGDAVEDLYPERSGETYETLMNVSSLSVDTELRDVSLEIRRGEIMGVFGLLGSGIGVLGKALVGALETSWVGGAVQLEGYPFHPKDPRESKEAGVGYVPAERKREGIFPDLNVRENITLPFIRRFVRGLMVSVSDEERHVEIWRNQLSIQSRGTSQKIRYLSGGNQQKVVLARWLVDGMKLLIVDEPTRGVDIGARAEIYAALQELTDTGLGILLITSDVDEVAGVCDRVVVLDRGRVGGTYHHGVSQRELIRVATGAVQANK